jgi:hypothetical protein
MKHKLVFENMMAAQCSCGEWKYVGLSPEARLGIEKIYKYHLPSKKKAKKRK